MIRDVFFIVFFIIIIIGFLIVDFDKWLIFLKIIFMFLMFCGVCVGLIVGGFKVFRFVIFIKKFVREFKKIGYLNKVLNIKFEGKILDKEMFEGVDSYFIFYLVIFFILLLIIVWDFDIFIIVLSVVFVIFNNIGFGFGVVGFILNFVSYLVFIKIVLLLGMLLGCLEIILFLILVLFRIYRKRD